MCSKNAREVDTHCGCQWNVLLVTPVEITTLLSTLSHEGHPA